MAQKGTFYSVYPYFFVKERLAYGVRYIYTGAMDHATSHPIDASNAQGPVRAKSELAYEELRRRIMEMELEPGTPLLETELIDSLGFGRTPTREAIQRLASERLIVARPRQTPYVAPILAHELAEIIEMRFVLEVPAARYAALRATAPERDSLRRAAAQFCGGVASSNRQLVVDSDNEIHRLIVTSARNSYLADCMQRMAVFSRRLKRLSSDNVDFANDAFLHCHDEMVAAICSGDSDGAAASATEHVLLFKRRLSRLVKDLGALRPGATSA